MDQRERFEDPEEALRAALDGWQATIWTCLIGIVQTVNLTANTCTVQPAMRGVKRAEDGTVGQVLLPVCADVPIAWPAGGGFVLTFPLATGDEGLLLFGSRCIDPWWQSGGVQDQIDLRMHDLSDAVFLAGVKSQPNRVASVSSSGTELRSLDGTNYVHVDQGVVKVRATTHIDLNGFVIDPSGNAVTPGEVTAKNTHTVSAHTHTQGPDSHGDTEVATNTPTG